MNKNNFFYKLPGENGIFMPFRVCRFCLVTRGATVGSKFCFKNGLGSMISASLLMAAFFIASEFSAKSNGALKTIALLSLRNSN